MLVLVILERSDLYVISSNTNLYRTFQNKFLSYCILKKHTKAYVKYRRQWRRSILYQSVPPLPVENFVALIAGEILQTMKNLTSYEGDKKSTGSSGTI